MEKNNLFTLLKYYKGEETNPNRMGSDAALWWEGEKAFINACCHNSGFFSRVRLSLEDAIRSNGVNGLLADNSIDINRRVVIYYLDLWHGKWFPYDDFDRIFTY